MLAVLPLIQWMDIFRLFCDMLQHLTKSVHNQEICVIHDKVGLVTVWNVHPCILFIIQNYVIFYDTDCTCSREHASNPLSLKTENVAFYMGAGTG